MAGRVQKRYRTVRLYGKRKPDPIVKPHHIDVDLVLAKEMLEASLERRGLTHEKPIGKCYDCGKRVTGERKVCGQCARKRNEAPR